MHPLLWIEWRFVESIRRRGRVLIPEVTAHQIFLILLWCKFNSVVWSRWRFDFGLSQFQEEPQVGFLCGKCRCQIEAFHLFYTRIECIHNSLHRQETIFVETLYNCPKEEPENESYNDESCFDEPDVLSNSPDLPSTDNTVFKAEKKKGNKRKRREKASGNLNAGLFM